MQQSDSHPIDRWISLDPAQRSRSKLSALAGCTPGRITQICDDGEFPSRNLAIRLHEITGIPFVTLMGVVPQDQSARAGGHA
ncbi:hypothetical protein IZ6_07510 [Terrihabitans soli]|uniref:XRE family transcriptional regulator n=1 Tax=Terrihabitans soli TaxID=708113 RepID=A0A6S6QL48_9HYPH|nr:hypothetical protein IZ6_07510 [Terrihabitans soli]